jgi:hypothetical protein
MHIRERRHSAHITMTHEPTLVGKVGIKMLKVREKFAVRHTDCIVAISLAHSEDSILDIVVRYERLLGAHPSKNIK